MFMMALGAMVSFSSCSSEEEQQKGLEGSWAVVDLQKGTIDAYAFQGKMLGIVSSDMNGDIIDKFVAPYKVEGSYIVYERDGKTVKLKFEKSGNSLKLWVNGDGKDPVTATKVDNDTTLVVEEDNVASNATVTTKDLEGTWVWRDSQDTETFTFKGNTVVAVRVGDSKVIRGTYTIEGNYLVGEFEGDYGKVKFELSGNTLKLWLDGDKPMIFVKQ